MAQLAKGALVARFDYYASESHELTVLEGDQLTLLDDSSPWWKVKNANGDVGYVPSNYVRPVRQNLFKNLKNSLGRRKGTSVTKTSQLYSNCSGQPLPDKGIKTEAGSPGGHENGTLGRAVFPLTGPNRSTLEHSNKALRALHCEESHIYHTTIPTNRPVVNLSRNFRGEPAQPGAGSRSPQFNQKRTTLVPTSDETLISPVAAELLYRVIASYQPQRSDELHINAGDRIRVLEKSADGWWFGEIMVGDQVRSSGWFPSNYVVVDVKNKNVGHGSLRNFRHPENRAVSVIPAFAPSNTSPTFHVNDKPSKLTAITLYPYVRNHLEEISFTINEVLEILERPSENADWMRCRNARGDIGWVPSNHLRILYPSLAAADRNLSRMACPTAVNPYTPRTRGLEQNIQNYVGTHPPPSAPSPPESMIDGEAVRLTHALKSRNSGAHLRKPWFWGAINQAECEYILHQYSHPGDFIIRDSTSNPNDLTIVLNSGNLIRNFRITVSNGCYHIGMRVFPSVEELIFHFQRHYIFTSKFESCFLVRPFAHPGFLQSSWYAVNEQLIPPVYTPVFRPYEAVCGTQMHSARTLSR
ncbi:hypothetical protein T265_09086 [Opisthorchis viverrini]|uniref:SH3 domain protein n=1 Tax=Opisthorchis viverrini TaxID=6198 RepID=A0A074Z740_OPIVI|nr:hypothetical protein T265_09086 [Opisthorchis viverrini]KER22913.1 hypothetical protein T265_09086 [Opisthorchis viverrini]